MHLMKTTALCALMGLTALPLPAQEKALSEIDVIADLSSYQNANALDYWPSIEADIETEIQKLVSIDDGGEAPRMRVELSKIAVNGSTLLPTTGEFNELEGTVVLFEGLSEDANTEVDGDTGKAEQSFPLSVSAYPVGVEAPEGVIVLPPAKDDFYEALVAGFAREAVRFVDQ